MKVLILVAHADPFGHSAIYPFALSAKEALIEMGSEVKFFDLVKEGFDRTATIYDFNSIKNPDDFHYANEQAEDNLIPLIREHQEHVEWCTHMLIFGPMWYFRFPATFYAYFERVFTNGFGYTPTKFVETGPMKGKFAMCITTCGNKPDFINPKGGLSSIEGLMYHTISGHLRYCGFSVLRSQAFCSVESKNFKENLPELLTKWKKAIMNLHNRPMVPFFKFGMSDPSKPNELQFLAGLEDLSLDEAINYSLH